MNATTHTPAAEHTCFGARFCGAPAEVATAECPACTPARPLLEVLADHVARVTAERRLVDSGRSI